MSYAEVAFPYDRETLSRRFSHDGYLSLDTVTTAADIARVRSLLDPLFDRFDTLGARATDLAGPAIAGKPLRSPEINEASVLAPALRETGIFKRCRKVAQELLGAPAGHVFDHAIYKPPYNQSPTAWHQDEVYSRIPIPLRTVHFWIPLQDTTVQNGCMWYIPGSHLQGPVPHKSANIRTAGSSEHVIGATLVAENVESQKAVACPVPLGGMTLHHPLTLHYAGANQTGDSRRAWILHFGAYGKWRLRLHPRMISARLGKLFGQGSA